jgi:hypothetical protein
MYMCSLQYLVCTVAPLDTQLIYSDLTCTAVHVLNGLTFVQLETFKMFVMQVTASSA